MQRVVNRAACRHRSLSEYFGQPYAQENCGACDFCLQELEPVPDAHVIAQKILSAVARTGQRFGSSYVIDVLRGSKNAKVIERGHERLPTFGLLAQLTVPQIGNYIDQLIDNGDLQRSDGEYPVLQLTAGSVEIMKSQREAVLVAQKQVLTARPRRERSGRRRAAADDERELTPVEQELFEVLRGVRRELASELGVPPYIVFGDVTLEAMARQRPGSELEMLQVKGIGQKKYDSFGARFRAAIAGFQRTGDGT